MTRLSTETSDAVVLQVHARLQMILVNCIWRSLFLRTAGESRPGDAVLKVRRSFFRLRERMCLEKLGVLFLPTEALRTAENPFEDPKNTSSVKSEKTC